MSWIIAILIVLAVAVLLVLRKTAFGVAVEAATAFLRTPWAGHGIVVHVETDPRNMNLGYDLLHAHAFVFPPDVVPSDPPEDELAWRAWAHGQGAVDAYITRVVITMQATLERVVVVDAPRLVSKESPLREGLLRGPVGRGGNGGVIPRMWAFDLDSRNPRPTYTDPSGSSRPPEFALRKGDSERLDVICTATTTAEHHWHLIIPLLVDGQRIELTVKERRDGFVTVGGEGIEGTWWDDEREAWDPTAYDLDTDT